MYLRRRLAIPAAAAAAALFAANACLGARKTDVMVKQRIEKFEVPRYQDGKLFWKLVCTAAEILENKEVRLEGPKLHVVPVDGKPGYDISAKRGTLTGNRTIVNLEKDVSMISTEGDTLTADSLTWNTATETATSDSRVVVKRQNMELAGKGITAQSKSRDLKIHSNARLVMTKEKVKPGQKGVITVDSEGAMTFKENLAVFTGRPKARNETGAAMTSDRLALELDMESETVRKAVGTGNVVFASEEVSGSSRKTEWAPDTDTIRMYGRVRLADKRDGNTVQAEQVELSLTNRRMVCPGPATLTLYPDKKREPE
jgi:LPS export ABC transporter protein LptC